MSLLRNVSSKTRRAVGTGVGAKEVDGASEGDSVISVGSKETLGTVDGASEGNMEIEGNWLGCVDTDG